MIAINPINAADSPAIVNAIIVDMKSEIKFKQKDIKTKYQAHLFLLTSPTRVIPRNAVNAKKPPPTI